MTHPPKRKRVSKTGKPPGSLIYIGEDRLHTTQIDVHNYNANEYQKLVNVNAESIIKEANNPYLNTWIDINGIHAVPVVKHICEIHQIHSLTIEDIINTFQRPKTDEYEGYIFVTFKMLLNNQKLNLDDNLKTEQFSILLLDHKIITFQELPGDSFQEIRNRLKLESSKLRNKGVDYLLYLLMDNIVDKYIDFLEHIGEVLETNEEELIKHHFKGNIKTLIGQKKKLLYLRNEISPIRESVNRLMRLENPLIKENTYKYFNDLQDHVHQVLEQIDLLIDLNKSQLDIYFATLSHKMNKVMETLTIITAIFIPLTFIAGIYGMNFENMPELQLKYGYFIALGVMALIAIGMILLFKKRKWL